MTDQAPTESLIGIIVRYGDAIKDGRDYNDVMGYLNSEVRELEDEVLARNFPNTAAAAFAGPDGIFGEAIDVLINCVDMLRKERPDATIEELEAEAIPYVIKKCEKWLRKARDKAQAS